MPKGAASPFRSIVGRLRARMTQQVAQALKRCRHPRWEASEWRHRCIACIAAPGREAFACLLKRAPLSVRIVPEQIALLHKAPRDLELRTDRTGQQRGDLGLVLGPQMI